MDDLAGLRAAPPALASDFSAAISLASLDGTNGFRIDGVASNDQSGWSVASAGDVNGDGYDDVIVGARFADPGGADNAGSSYVVFGAGDGFAANFSLGALDGANGFRIDGIDADDWSAYSVASAGDVNGDGFDDVVIGAIYADPGNRERAGESYVVFGQAGGFGPSISLSGLNGANGFRLDGVAVRDKSGFSVASAGDVNGDGFDDVIVGAGSADTAGGGYSGASYVVFGKAGGFGASLSLAGLNGSNGFRVDGVDPNDRSGTSVASAGDVNGDGFDDIIIGTPGVSIDQGESYVVFGKAGGFAASIDGSSLNGTNGFRIEGDLSGQSVASAGDVNGDGYDDVIIGALAASPGDGYAGVSYVVFGKAGAFGATVNLSALNGSNGFRLVGEDAYDYSGSSVSSAGDVNGDGFDDIIIGASGSLFGDNPGKSYVVFGKAGGFGSSINLGALGEDDGFRIDGIDQFDRSGWSVASAGDVDADGFDDIIVGAPFAGSGGESYVIFGRANFGGGGETIVGTNGPDSLVGGAAGEVLQGLAGDDTLQGNGGGDALDGAGGLDWADYASAAAKVLADLQAPNLNTGDAAGDVYVEVENVRGGGANDALRGDAGANILDGGAKNDNLSGRKGDDTLIGGDGKDTLKGGKGADQLVLASLDPDEADKIAAFDAADVIALDSDIYGLSESALDADAFIVANQAQDAEDRIIYNAANGKLFFDPDGTGAQAQIQIASFFAPAPMLDASDFIVI